MQEEHTTRIQIKVDDTAAQASIERLVNELQRAQEIAQNLFVGGAPLGAVGAAQTARASGAVNGGGTSTTAGGGLTRTGTDRDEMGVSQAANDMSRAQRHARALGGATTAMASAIGTGMGTPSAGAGGAAFLTGLDVIGKVSSDIANQPMFGVLGAGLGYLTQGANLLHSNMGGVANLQMQRLRIHGQSGMDPGIGGAMRVGGTAYDAGMFGLHTGAGKTGSTMYQPGQFSAPGVAHLVNKIPIDPQMLGFTPEAAMGITGQFVGALGSRFASNRAAKADMAFLNPHLMAARGVNVGAVGGLLGRAFTAGDVGVRGSIGMAGDTVATIQQMLLMAEHGFGYRGAGLDQFTGRLGALGAIPGAMGGAADLDGVRRVIRMSFVAGGKSKGMPNNSAFGMKALNFSQHAMQKGMGSYQKTLSGFGDMGDVLSDSYAARHGGGSVEGYLAAKMEFASNPRLYGREAALVFGVGSTGMKIALRQAGMAGNFLGKMSKSDFHAQNTAGLPTPQISADSHMDIIMQGNRLARSQALGRRRLLANVAGKKGSDQDSLMDLDEAVTKLTLGMQTLGRVIAPVTEGFAFLMDSMRDFYEAARKMLKKVGITLPPMPPF